MKLQHLALSTCLCALAACSGLGLSSDGGSSSSTKTTAPSAGTQAGASQGDAIASQAEFDSQATKSITQQNADAEFEKLKKEIEGDG